MLSHSFAQYCLYTVLALMSCVQIAVGVQFITVKNSLDQNNLKVYQFYFKSEAGFFLFMGIFTMIACGYFIYYTYSKNRNSLLVHATFYATLLIFSLQTGVAIFSALRAMQTTQIQNITHYLIKIIRFSNDKQLLRTFSTLFNMIDALPYLSFTIVLPCLFILMLYRVNEWMEYVFSKNYQVLEQQNRNLQIETVNADKKSTIIILIMSFFMVVNASTHLSTGSSILAFYTAMDSHEVHKQKFIDIKFPYFMYLNIIGLIIFAFIVLNCIAIFINHKKTNKKLTIFIWFFNWLLISFNFAAGVVLIFSMLFQFSLYQQVNPPRVFLKMYHLQLADTFVTFLIGSASLIVLLNINNYRAAKYMKNVSRSISASPKLSEHQLN